MAMVGCKQVYGWHDRCAFGRDHPQLVAKSDGFTSDVSNSAAQSVRMEFRQAVLRVAAPISVAARRAKSVCPIPVSSVASVPFCC